MFSYCEFKYPKTFAPVRNSLLRAPVSMPASPKKVTLSLHLGDVFFCRCHCCMPLLKRSVLDTQMENVFVSSTCNAIQSKISAVLEFKTQKLHIEIDTNRSFLNALTYFLFNTATPHLNDKIIRHSYTFYIIS